MWKDIIGWEGLYQVNENGDVINKITKHVLVGDVNPAGYCRVCLYCKQHKPPKQRFSGIVWLRYILSITQTTYLKSITKIAILITIMSKTWNG